MLDFIAGFLGSMLRISALDRLYERHPRVVWLTLGVVIAGPAAIAIWL